MSKDTREKRGTCPTFLGFTSLFSIEMASFDGMGRGEKAILQVLRQTWKHEKDVSWDMDRMHHNVWDANMMGIETSIS